MTSHLIRRTEGGGGTDRTLPLRPVFSSIGPDVDLLVDVELKDDDVVAATSSLGGLISASIR